MSCFEIPSFALPPTALWMDRAAPPIDAPLPERSRSKQDLYQVPPYGRSRRPRRTRSGHPGCRRPLVLGPDVWHQDLLSGMHLCCDPAEALRESLLLGPWICWNERDICYSHHSSWLALLHFLPTLAFPCRIVACKAKALPASFSARDRQVAWHQRATVKRLRCPTFHYMSPYNWRHANIRSRSHFLPSKTPPRTR